MGKNWPGEKKFWQGGKILVRKKKFDGEKKNWQGKNLVWTKKFDQGKIWREEIIWQTSHLWFIGWFELSRFEIIWYI